MAKLSKEELIDAFKEMTLLELSEFVKEFEDVFDVEAAAPTAVAVAAPGAAGGEEAAEEKTEFDVVLEGPGDKKIAVIKALRALQPGLALKEAKEKVDSAPTTVLEGAAKEDAEKAKEELEGAGATVALK